MNTRNRGTQNNTSFSRGRNRSLRASRHNISIEGTPKYTKPLTVHSPVEKNTPQAPPQVTRAQSFTNLPTNSNKTNVVIMDNNPSSLPHNFFALKEQSSSFSNIGMANNPPMTTSNGSNSNNTTPFDNLITIMKETIRNTREEFRKELSSIRDSISQIGNASDTTSQRRPFIQSHTRF